MHYESHGNNGTTISRRRLMSRATQVSLLGLAMAAVPLAACRSDSLKDLVRGVGTAAGSTGKLTSPKDLLKSATDRSLDRVGTPGGFLNDQIIRIALPGPLAKIQDALGFAAKLGLTKDMSKLLNTAAETAAREAKPLFRTAIDDMTLTDAAGILTGGNDAATKYFRKSAGPQVNDKLTPLISSALGEVGAFKQLNKLTKRAPVESLKMSEADLTSYVTEKAMDGIFHYIGVEEAAIRKDPLKLVKGAL